MLKYVTLAVCLAPGLAFAVGSSSDTPPEPTETTEVCENGQVWDAETEACVDAESDALNDVERGQALRELAYAGRTEDALRVLDALEDQSSDLAMTYRGFLARQGGDWDRAQVLYAAAIKANPDNLLARSYLGQGYVSVGDFVAARAELTEIRMRGGRESWPEVALTSAIESGVAPSY